MNDTARSHPCAVQDCFREATAAQHRALEAHPVLAAVTAADVDRAALTAMLQVQLHFHDGVETALRHSLRDDGTLPLDLPERSADLRHDLALLGAAAPVPAPAPVYASAEHAVGGWYVLEGSALGTLVIRRHLGRCFDAAILEQLRFLPPEPQPVAARWRRFQRFLQTRYAGGGEGLDAALTGARQTFSHFADLLER